MCAVFSQEYALAAVSSGQLTYGVVMNHFAVVMQVADKVCNLWRHACCIPPPCVGEAQEKVPRSRFHLRQTGAAELGTQVRE